LVAQVYSSEPLSTSCKSELTLNWYVGGLNYQIEHHLFPHMCHLLYPKIAPIVRATCQEFGLPYRSYPTFRAALKNHWRSLREFGRPPELARE
jgi:linoleoyl-CoA desaturase